MAQGNPKALIPILVFVVLYLGLGITLVALRVYRILKTAWATPMSPAFSPVGCTHYYIKIERVMLEFLPFLINICSSSIFSEQM